MTASTPPYTSDSKQFVILQRLTTLLQGITPANGYSLDLTDRVFRGKTVFGAQEPTPFVSILESLRPDPNPLTAGFEKSIREEQWELLVQGWATANQAFPTDGLYGLKAAMEHRLARMVTMTSVGSPAFPDDYRLGRILTDVYIGPGVVRASTPQIGTEALYLPLRLCYKANVTDPWDLS